MQSTFRIGQLVHLKKHVPGQADSRAFCITGILRPKPDGIPTYVIKNATGAERVVEQREITAASARSMP